MFQISETDFLIDTHPRDRNELERHALVLFEEYEKFLNISIRLEDYAIEFDLENGSLSGRGKVWVTLGSIYAFVSGYGAFASGIEAMASHAKAVGEYLTVEAPKLVGEPGAKIAKHRTSAGQLKELQVLFKKVREGKLQPDEAVILATQLLEQTDEQFPEGLNGEIRRSFEHIKLNPLQSKLPFEIGGAEALQVAIKKPPREPKPTQPPEAIADNNRLRIEIRRDGKNKERQIRVVERPTKSNKLANCNWGQTELPRNARTLE